MINRFPIQALRNAEYYQFMVSAHELFEKHGVDREHLQSFYDELGELIKAVEIGLAAERNNDKIREKNEMDRYRDRLHSRLFNYVKSILYDEHDPQFDDAQAVMRILKDVGNPNNLAENAQSAMLTTLGNRLSSVSAQIEAIGATMMVERLMEANQQFIRLEVECREIIASRRLTPVPSATAVRKNLDPVYRNIIDALNGYARIPVKRERYRELIYDMNVLVARYDALLSNRRSSRRERDNSDGQTNGCEC